MWRSAALLLYTLSSLLTAQAAPVSDLFSSLFTASGYDNQLRPFLNTSLPVVINTAMRINLLYNVDSKEETFQLDMFVTEWWIDPRLRFSTPSHPLPSSSPSSSSSSSSATTAATAAPTIGDTLNNNILRIPSKYTPWLPDTFFFNSIKCAAVADSSLTLSSDGTVTYSRHQQCTFHSSFDLQNFPFDSQTLSVRRTSFSYTDDQLQLNFPRDSAPTGWRPDPRVDFTNSLWDLSYAFSNASSLVFINTHSANAYIVVQRRWQAYVLKMILPMFLLVLLSTLSYAVDPAAPPARVAFSVALILSIVTFNLVVSQDLPKINYATLLDWYVWYCFLFVVVSLGEYAAVNNLNVTKRYGPAVPYLIDDFCLWVAPFTWVITNVWYWPFYNSVGLTLFLVMVWSAWVLVNIYRVHWNYHNNKRGLWEPTKALYAHLRGRWNRHRAPAVDDRSLSLSPLEEQKADETIALAERTGANVFDLGVVTSPPLPPLSSSDAAAAAPSASSSSSFAAPVLSPEPSVAFSPSPSPSAAASDDLNPFESSPEAEAAPLVQQHTPLPSPSLSQQQQQRQQQQQQQRHQQQEDDSKEHNEFDLNLV